MRVVARIDAGGFFLEDLLLEDDEPIPPDAVENRPQEGFHRPRWTGSVWEEGKPAAEIVEEARPMKSQEMREAAAAELRSRTQAVNTDEAISAAVVRFFEAWKAGGAPPPELEDLANIHKKLEQKLYEVATSPDPEAIQWT